MPKTIKDITGIRFGRLIVIQLASQYWNGATLWLCKCDCGKEKIIFKSHLQSGNTKSCGCLHKEIMTGESNPNYKNGRQTKVAFEQKEKIRKRDNYTCQECDKIQKQNLKETGRILDVHHIDGNDTNNAEENMITLCCSCHRKLEPNRQLSKREFRRK